MRSLLRNLVVVAALLPTIGSVVAQDRVALVIGNGDYQHVAHLPNPLNDAADIAAALERIGFSVTLAKDLEGNAMRAALHQFSTRAANADMALVYYAGHGIEIDKQNYLIPVDAALATDRDVNFEAVPLDLVSEAVSGARTLRIVLLDACRNNPFSAQMNVTTPNRSIGRGLTAPELGGGTLIAYSAKGGTTAEDGNGRNSPFAKALLDNIEQPGLEIDFLFRKVRDAVLTETRQRQEPFVYGSLPGERIYLVPPAETATARVTAPLISGGPVLAASGQETFAWQLASQSQDPKVVQDFIYAFPRGFYLEVALARLRELTAAPRSESTTVTAVTPPAPAATAAPVLVPPDPAVARRELVVAVQTALRNAGCSPGAADGNWGPRSRAALARFADADGLPMGSEPTSAILAILKLRSHIRCQASAAADTTAPSPPPTNPPPPQGPRTTIIAPIDADTKRTQLIADIQRHLASSGCRPGAVTGDWSASDRATLEWFLAQSGLIPSTREPTPALLRQIRTVRGRIC